MSVEQLEAALNGERDPYLIYGHPMFWTAIKNDILALIEKEKENAVADCDQCISQLIQRQPRVLTLDDWKQPDILQRVVRRDKQPHGFDRVVATDLCGDYPVLLESGAAEAVREAIRRYAVNGRYDLRRESEIDLLLPPRKLKRVVRYFFDEFDPSRLGQVAPDVKSKCTKPVTLIYQDTP